MNIRLGAMFLIAAAFAGCGGGSSGGGGPTSAPSGPPTLVWAANHEKGVNSPGGGYQISISGGQPPINVPYTSGPAAPTSLLLATLPKGTYTVSVRAFAALDAQGGTTVSFSAPSPSIVVNVP